MEKKLYSLVIPANLKEELMNEAKEQCMTLSSYIRLILLNRNKPNEQK